MKEFLAEIDGNYSDFVVDWQSALQGKLRALEADKAVYQGSYRRLVSLRSWRAALLEGQINQEALDFFVEAQNDALVSHAMAACGSWRTALKGLRSCIENVLACLYYKDHPVELQLWLNGEYRLGFVEVHKYFGKHPVLKKIPSSLTGLEILAKEYAILSKAVHASAASFRMTADGRVNLWSNDRAQLRKWATRERQTITGINLLILSLFHTKLQGGSLIGLRQALTLAIPSSMRRKIRETLAVKLPPYAQ